MAKATSETTVGAGHPSEVLLVDHTLGALKPAAALPVSAHIESCPVCRHAVEALDMLGGALLLSADVSLKLTPDLTAAPPHTIAPPAADRSSGVVEERRGAPRRFPGGIVVTPLRTPGSRPWRALLLSVKAGGRLPRHGHSGAELICVLQGAFTDGADTYRAGQFVETPCDGEDHELAVVGDSDCVCLVALEGPVRWRGAMRAFGPLVGL